MASYSLRRKAASAFKKRGKSAKSSKIGGKRYKKGFRTNKRGRKGRFSRKFQMGGEPGDLEKMADGASQVFLRGLTTICDGPECYYSATVNRTGDTFTLTAKFDGNAALKVLTTKGWTPESVAALGKRMGFRAVLAKTLTDFFPGQPSEVSKFDTKLFADPLSGLSERYYVLEFTTGDGGTATIKLFDKAELVHTIEGGKGDVVFKYFNNLKEFTKKDAPASDTIQNTD